MGQFTLQRFVFYVLKIYLDVLSSDYMKNSLYSYFHIFYTTEFVTDDHEFSLIFKNQVKSCGYSKAIARLV